MEKKWYETSFRRNLVDMHIDAWNPEFLRDFDPDVYFHCLKAAHIQSPMIYLQSHTGLCNWPTKSGAAHPALQDGEKIRRLIGLCHAAGMDVVGYYSLIFNNWAYDAHPDWRILDVNGRPNRSAGAQEFMSGGRYGLVCPNNADYRAFVNTQLAELFGQFELEGLFLDMTFWNKVCYCPACRERFARETGQSMPEVIDWSNPLWATLQQKREDWMGEFAAFCTDAVRRLSPTATVEHQFSTLVRSWLLGVGEGVNAASDYAGGDLYGGFRQQSFICKMYDEITQNRPFEYMTSRCDPDLMDHTTTKSARVLKIHNYLTLAHHGAFLLIDAIDPRGTLNPRVYETIGAVFEESMPYEAYLTGQPVAEAAVVFDLKSKMDTLKNGNRVDEPDESMPQLASAVSAATTLEQANLLYTVLPNCRIERIFGKQLVIVTNAPHLTASEIDTLIEYVAQGGSLYIGGATNPALAQRLLGLEFHGYTAETVTFLSPTAAGQPCFGELYSADYPLTCRAPQQRASNPRGHQVLATLTLPYTDPADTSLFASIHSNPPGRHTDSPAVVYGRCGKGRVLWSGAAIEGNDQQAHRQVFLRLVSLLVPDRLLTSDAPDSVNFTLFDDAENRCLYLNCVNIEERFPAPPVITVTLRTAYPICEALLLPRQEAVPFTYRDGALTLTVDDLDVFAMYCLRY